MLFVVFHFFFSNLTTLFRQRLFLGGDEGQAFGSRGLRRNVAMISSKSNFEVMGLPDKYAIRRPRFQPEYTLGQDVVGPQSPSRIKPPHGVARRHE